MVFVAEYPKFTNKQTKKQLLKETFKVPSYEIL